MTIHLESMTQYMIAFDDGDMNFPEEELPDVAEAAAAVVKEEGKEHLGGFAVVDVPSRDEALEWAAKTAVACRSRPMAAGSLSFA